jgi:hypothetical protein
LALAVRLQRTIGTENPKQNTNDTTWTEQSVTQGRAVEIASRFRGNTP